MLARQVVAAVAEEVAVAAAAAVVEVEEAAAAAAAGAELDAFQTRVSSRTLGEAAFWAWWFPQGRPAFALYSPCPRC